MDEEKKETATVGELKSFQKREKSELKIRFHFIFVYIVERRKIFLSNVCAMTEFYLNF